MSVKQRHCVLSKVNGQGELPSSTALSDADENLTTGQQSAQYPPRQQPQLQAVPVATNQIGIVTQSNQVNASCQTGTGKTFIRHDAAVSLKKQSSTGLVKNYGRALMGEQSLKQFGPQASIDSHTLQTVTTEEPSRSSLPAGGAQVAPKKAIPLVGPA